MWRYSSCEIQGRGHIKNQIPCQDKTKTCFLNDTYVISLADGAGTAKLSHYGAECVTNSITDLFTSDFDNLYNAEDGRQVKIAVAERLIKDINIVADDLACTPKDLAATMLAVAVKDDKFIIAHIGDGVIGYLDGKELKVASAPSNGEHANETYFVTSSDAINSLKLFKGNIKNIAGFVIMSDGTEQSLYNKRSNTLSTAVLKLMQRNVLLDEESMRIQLENTFRNVIITKTHDDCSIAILSRANDLLRPITGFSYAEKCELYCVNSKDRNAKKRVERYDRMLEMSQKPCSCEYIARNIHLKPQYTKQHMEHLCSLGLVKKENGRYHLKCLW